MRRYSWQTTFSLVVMIILLFSSCSGMPIRLPVFPTTVNPTATNPEPNLQQLPTFEAPPQDLSLEWTEKLSEDFCKPGNSGRFSSLIYNSGAYYSVQSGDPRSVWRYLSDEITGTKIAEPLAEDGKFIEALRVNDQWLVLLIFDHPMHVQGWRVEALSLKTNEQRRLIDNIEANENIVYLDMELQGDALYFLTHTVTGDSSRQLSSILAFNLAEGSQEILLSLESDLIYNQLAVSEKYLMISQSVSGKAPDALLPILFFNLETRQLEELMEISGSYPLMTWPLAAWSEQGPNQLPEIFKVFDFESGLSWPLLVQGEQPSNFDLSKKYLAWIDPTEPTSAFPTVFLMSLDDGHKITVSTEDEGLMPQFPQVRDDKLIIGLVRDFGTLDAQGMICAIPLVDLQTLSQPVSESTPLNP
jgi:hypothetical protein